MKRMLTVILVLILIAGLSLPALAARVPVAKAVHPVGEAATLEGVYQVVKATKKVPAFAVLKLFAPGDFAADGAAVPVRVPGVQLLGPINPALKGKYVRATGIVAASDGTAAFRRKFALTAPVFEELVKPASVTLNARNVTLKLGEQLALKAEVKPDGVPESVAFTSNAKKVATVSADGVISAVGKGTATITAKTPNGKKATVKVTVVIPVTGIAMTPANMDFVKIGATKKLTFTVLPHNATNKAIEFTSSHPEVATVTKKGVVKSVALGTATITAKTADGGFVSTCEVVVSPKVDAVQPTGVSVSPAELFLGIGEQSRLTATVTPASASDQGIIWISDYEDVATVDASGLVTARGFGSTLIIAETADGAHSASCAVTVGLDSLSLFESLSIEGKAENQNLLVGQTDQLALHHEPATMESPTVKQWLSNSPAVASVNPATGLVTARAPGVALITADTGGIDEYGGYAAGVAPVYVSATALKKAALTIGDFALQINGKSVDPAMSYDQFKAAVPGGDETIDHERREINYAFAGGFANFDQTTSRVINVRVDTSAAATPRDLKVGALTAKVLDLYGLPDGFGYDSARMMDTNMSIYYNLDAGGDATFTLYIDINPKTQVVEHLSVYRETQS